MFAGCHWLSKVSRQQFASKLKPWRTKKSLRNIRRSWQQKGLEKQKETRVYKDRLLPEKLTIQRLTPQVKGSSQKYARMGPLKRVDVLEDDMCAPQTIDVVKRACIAGFNMIGFKGW